MLTSNKTSTLGADERLVGPGLAEAALGDGKRPQVPALNLDQALAGNRRPFHLHAKQVGLQHIKEETSHL